LWAKSLNDCQLRHNHKTDDVEHRVPELMESGSRTMTLRLGDPLKGTWGRGIHTGVDSVKQDEVRRNGHGRRRPAAFAYSAQARHLSGCPPL
jgi:hypothetical protein